MEKGFKGPPASRRAELESEQRLFHARRLRQTAALRADLCLVLRRGTRPGGTGETFCEQSGMLALGQAGRQAGKSTARLAVGCSSLMV